MKSSRANALIAAILIFAAIGLTLAGMHKWRGPGPQLADASDTPNPPDPPSSATIVQDRPARNKTPQPERPPSRQSALDWQRDLYDPQTTAQAFSDAVDAAEAGDFAALRELHTLLALCRHIMEYVRVGGDREQYLSAQSVPANGMHWHETQFDRCAAIATASRFAKFPLSEGRLTTAYWENLAAGFDDPLFRSFAIANDVDSYGHAETGKREELRARISENLRHVLRSRDPAAWWDLGLRLRDARWTADRAVGLALVLVACKRGFDCTKDNVHNVSLRCDGNENPNCGSASTLAEAFLQSESAATNARAQDLYERVTLLMEQGNWSELEGLIPLDGTAFE